MTESHDEEMRTVASFDVDKFQDALEKQNLPIGEIRKEIIVFYRLKFPHILNLELMVDQYIFQLKAQAKRTTQQ